MRFSMFDSLRPRAVLAVCVVAIALVLAAGAPAAFAEEALPEAPWWHVNVGSRPTYLAPGGEGTIVVLATNLGDGQVNGESVPVTLTDKLPAGMSAISAQFESKSAYNQGSLEGACSVSSPQTVVCSDPGDLSTYTRLEVDIKVKLEATVPEGKIFDGVSVSGGETPPVSVSDPLTVSDSKTPFGIETYEIIPENADGSIDRQAGSHPFQVTTTTILNAGPDAELEIQPAIPKDLHFKLPPGLVGDPTPIPQCTEAQFYLAVCPVETQVGVAIIGLFNPLRTTSTAPLYNMVPAPGEPARFGFEAGLPVFLDTSIRTGEDYGVTVNSDNITETGQVLSAQVTFWGVPGDPRHDRARNNWQTGAYCLTVDVSSPSSCPKDTVSAPFLALPTSCSRPFESTVEGDSWSALDKPREVATPAGYTLHNQTEPSMALDGCNKLTFEPSIKVSPDGTEASSPSGLTVDVHVPQQEVLIPSGLAESDVKSIAVTLPEGVTINPAGADGLGACSVAQIGLDRPGFSSCADASKIGTAQIKTPLLPEPLEGSVYLAEQNENPFGSLVAMYIYVEDPKAGVIIKVAGEVKLNEQTGQIVTTFADNPPLPFEDATLHFFGGARAPLATPAKCGAYTTTTSIAPVAGSAPATPSSRFDITSGSNGSACESPLPFAPSLTAGTTSIQAGGVSPFTMTMSREDGSQSLQAISLKMPPGLSGLLAGVKLCGEAEANAGTCGPESEIGETTVSVGLGGDPFSVKGGKVYLTGPYEGAPFGLSIVNPAVAGPFNLGKVVVRAKIEVDPHTAGLTITSDDSGPYKIPTILDGIPLEIKHVNVTIDRPSFTFNPTNCTPMAITGSLASTEGASSALSVPFQVTNCAALAFKPGFEVSTSGHTSRPDGASLSVKLTYPKAPQGTQANVAKVKVELPKQLPSRLTTLQKACAAQTFAANPASCPSTSVVGHAVVHTQLLPVPLEGPAYFVSNGKEAFPNLIVVLQGYGVTIDLVGDTFIKNGVTSSTFAATPDVPFESFELTLPEGPYSALAANGELCRQKLVMPTAFTAQSGAALSQSTRIDVTGCPHALSVLSERVSKRSVKLGVYVPAAGKLTISGRGVASAGKSATGPEALSLTLNRKGSGKLTTGLKVAFTPSTGRRQTRTVRVTFSG
jgi:hypothetical protein